MSCAESICTKCADGARSKLLYCTRSTSVYISLFLLFNKIAVMRWRTLSRRYNWINRMRFKFVGWRIDTSIVGWSIFDFQRHLPYRLSVQWNSLPDPSVSWTSCQDLSRYVLKKWFPNPGNGIPSIDKLRERTRQSQDDNKCISMQWLLMYHPNQWVK